MKSTIFIPQKINVGFQSRSDTYTSKLAYIIYFDEKGKLRKETSWNSWRTHELGNMIEENIPTSGFVLNKKAGGHSSGWNHRQAYVRVYDPRGFEFEIGIENLLFILENTSSIKGKGLEGEFVYGWDGKDLILIPTESPDYVEISAYSEILKEKLKLKAKDLKLGATYLTKDNTEYVYLGKFDRWGTNYDNRFIDDKEQSQYEPMNYGKEHYFRGTNGGIMTTKSLVKFISVISEECVENYAEMVAELEKNSIFSPVVHSKTTYVPYTVEEIKERFEVKEKGWMYVFLEDRQIQLKKYKKTDLYNYQEVNPKYENSYGWNHSDIPYWIKHTYKDAEEVVEKLKPMRKVMSLANGYTYNGGYY